MSQASNTPSVRDNSRFRDSIAETFVIYCDENGLTLREGLSLADALHDTLEMTAEDRRSYLPVEMASDE